MTRRPDDVVTVIVEPSSGILRAAWAGQLLTGSLIDSYYQLLEVAVAEDYCRYWHLDVRMSIWPAATFMSWLTDTFASHATQRLGGPVYVAFWTAEHSQAHVDDPSTVAMQQRVAQMDFYPAFFTSEVQARAWLLQQQAHDVAQAEG